MTFSRRLIMRYLFFVYGFVHRRDGAWGAFTEYYLYFSG